jgi:methylated-DNA-[protein]-cysteine S-methyltransferase
MMMYTTWIDSPLGNLSLACDEEAVTEISFTRTTLPTRQEHPLLKQAEEQLAAYFAGERRSFDFPMKQEGTSFQQTVWKLLGRIPFGETCSYLDLSRQFGEVKAIRAVAAANGRNRLAIVVPCHRVIGSSGALTGYAGGLWRKKWLLQHEGAGPGAGQLQLNL